MPFLMTPMRQKKNDTGETPLRILHSIDTAGSIVYVTFTRPNIAYVSTKKNITYVATLLVSS